MAKEFKDLTSEEKGLELRKMALGLIEHLDDSISDCSLFEDIASSFDSSELMFKALIESYFQFIEDHEQENL